MPRKTLITGGAGFIGSHLAQRLAAQGRSLILVDDLSTGRVSNIASLLDSPDADHTLIEAPIGEALRDPALLDDVEEIYHLAAAVGVKLIVDDPTGMIRNNIDQTQTVLEAAANRGIRVLITSSSEVYGKCPTLPLREDMELVYGPTTASRWSYGLTKALDEHLAIDYARRRGLQTVIVRLFNTIGPRQVGRYGMVVPRFVARAVAGQPLEIYGDGTQTRAFCDVRDVVVALTTLLGRPDCHGRVFNVGSQTPITINELADHVLALAESTAGKRYIPYNMAYGEGFEDPLHRLPDTTRLREAINFKPRHRIEDTLRELIRVEREKHSFSAATCRDQDFNPRQVAALNALTPEGETA